MSLATTSIPLYIWEVLHQSQRLAYARLTAELRLGEHSPNFATLVGISEPIVEGGLTEKLPEFIGAESALHEVRQGRAPAFMIERLQRSTPINQYLTFRVLPYAADELLLLVEDVSAEGQLEQTLVQERNELRLAQAKLAHTNTELERLNRFKVFLLSMVAHDLRAPLAAMRGYAELTLDDLLGERRDPILNLIAIADRMEQLIQNLLDLSQIEQGQLILRFATHNLADLVQEVAIAYQTRAALRQQTLTLRLPTTPLPAAVDDERFQQIVHNLLSNALKYTPAGGHITLTLAASAEAITMSVEDTGPGLSPSQQTNLFQLYYRTDETRRSKAPGTGLGLFIVKTLTEAHGGRVSVTSQPGQGSVFEVRLPRP